MARYRHVIFVCTNERPEGKECCKKSGSPVLLERLKAAIKARKLSGEVRATASGCLDMCKTGCAAVVYSEGKPGRETWYGNLTPDDAEKILECHLQGERLEDHVQHRSEV